MRLLHTILGTTLTLLTSGAAGCATAQQSSTRPDPTFFPAPPAEPRLQFLATISRATDVEERSGFADFVTGEAVELGIGRPHGTCWSDGRLYVCDPGAQALLVFDYPAKELRVLLTEQPGTLQKPMMIAAAPDGWKYVVDATRKLVVVLDDQDRFRTTFGDPTAWRPVGVAATQEHVYVTDVAEHRIVVLDRRTGERVGTLGEPGRDPGQFAYPVNVVLGPDGDLWVTDSFNFRIQRIRTDGTPVATLGSVGDRPGTFTRPKSAAVDRDGRCYVVDAAFENVQLFDAEDQLLLFFGAPGSQPGAMNLPAHVTLSYEAVPQFADRVADGYELVYVLFVSNQLGDQRVNVYGFLRPR